jgi:hypothetical protein
VSFVDEFGFGPQVSEGYSEGYKALVDLDRGDKFTLGRKEVYRVIERSRGATIKIVVVDGGAERKSYLLRPAGQDYTDYSTAGVFERINGEYSTTPRAVGAIKLVEVGCE